jgi:hypothetical protein
MALAGAQGEISMTPEDGKIVAETAAKAANMGVAAHEAAKHAGEKETVPSIPRKPVGYTKTDEGDGSSKRLESFIGLGAAIVIAGIGLAMGEKTITPILCGAFLTYSLTMQGVSAKAEAAAKPARYPERGQVG